MIPWKLKINGFLSYAEAVELDFSSFDLACISGSNGAGKSSLLDAITWVLFGEARGKTDDLINTRCSKAEVEFIFDYENQRYRVLRTRQRGKTGSLDVFISNGDGNWRVLTEATMSDTQRRIRQEIKLDYDTFTNASFFLQGKADQFTQQKAADRKHILSNVLGLDVWEEYKNRAAEKRKTFENDLKGIEGQLEEIDRELALEEQHRTNLAALQAELAQIAARCAQKEHEWEQQRRLESQVQEQGRLVQQLGDQADVARRRLEERTALQNSRREECDRFEALMAQAARVEEDYGQWQQARTAVETMNQDAARFHEFENRLAEPRREIEVERARLDQELTGLDAQREQAAAWQAQLPTLNELIVGLTIEVQTAAVQLQQRAQLETELEGLQTTQVDAEAENKRLRAAMDELKERIVQLSAAGGANCPLCGQPLGAAEGENLVESLNLHGKEMGDRFRANQKTCQDIVAQREEIQANLRQLQQLEKSTTEKQRRLDQCQNDLDGVQSNLQQWQSNGAVRLVELRQRLEQQDFAAEARTRITQIEAELRDLGYDAAAHQSLREREQTLRAVEEEFRNLERARASLQSLQRELQQLTQDAEQARAEWEKLAADHRAAHDNYQAAKASLPDVIQTGREVTDLREQEKIKEREVGGAQQWVRSLENQRTRRAALEEKARRIRRQVEVHRTLERAFGKDGVPALLIEQALPEIEEQANDLLDRLSVGGMSVRFETQKEYKDKHREDKRETLDILISDGAGTREYEMFSGGEAFRVNFAIRLALSRVLARRAGARLQTLVIDEGFGSQDADGRQRLIEAINLVKPDFEKILVITHLEELKDAFPARIEVEKTPNGSQVKVVT